MVQGDDQDHEDISRDANDNSKDVEDGGQNDSDKNSGCYLDIAANEAKCDAWLGRFAHVERDRRIHQQRLSWELVRLLVLPSGAM